MAHLTDPSDPMPEATITLRLADIKEFKFLTWALGEIIEDMYAHSIPTVGTTTNASKPDPVRVYAERLEAAVRQFTVAHNKPTIERDATGFDLGNGFQPSDG